MTVKFTPAKDYGGLLKQARALHTVVKCQDESRAFDSKKIKELEDALACVSVEEIESLRATNEILTEEVERLEGELDKFRRM